MEKRKFYLKAAVGLLGIVAVFGLVYELLAGRYHSASEVFDKNFSARADFNDNFMRSALNYIRESIRSEKRESAKSPYFLHKNITSTVFWIGEKASDANNNISNSPSAWDEKWKNHFGGTDSPKERTGFRPAKFYPKENPFYVALPYNDFDSRGKRKEDAFAVIPWVDERKWKKTESLCKNRWVKISKDGKEAYAQWEDVGPYEEDDPDYVFGRSDPKNKINKSAGIDVSPAVRDYLDLKDIDKVDWQFADDDSIPDGPWKEIVTRSGIYWK